MNWFDTSGLTSLAKTALKEAQKTIDKALDIQDESGEETENESPTQHPEKSSPGNSSTPQKDNSDFFSSWGLTVSAESSKDDPIKEQPVVTESPSKATTQSIWGSFAGSFFEQPKDGEAGSTIVRPPKAKSMNLISDVKYGSQEDLFSKSQLVMSDGAEGLEMKMKCKDDIVKDDRRSSTRSNRLSLMSSRNSSDSVEVLSQSLKTTPDSDGVSGQSMSHSSSAGQKLNSESVEVLPDSLVSPSSIECLGFDSYSSDKNSSTSSNLSPGDLSDKKATPVGEQTERAETADSISLVADDDEDTMSYNSISECTAPTVLDTDEKPVSPFQKAIRTEPKKGVDKDFIHLEQSIPQKMHLSENSSNDGSWSDRTLNADSDSIILEATEEQKKDEHEDTLMERLSDSSSFYNVNVTAEMSRSDTSAFVNIEKHQCSAAVSSESSQKDCSVKERTSPISSDSKSDLVKIGSDRTSGHTSGDELETTTSSDIEIIPSPNGDNNGFRNSPAKYAFKQGKFDGNTSPNLVDLVLGKSLATKIRGHNRELSEASVQSNTSDESQCSETDRLMRRLCEMAEILEARESRLMEVSRNNAELAENNADLKMQVESLMAKHEGGDISVITEDYTQRMSALEKKFQQAIREKDQLRKQLDSMKSECSSRKNSSELENALKEKDDVISQLQEEGEKLSKQQLQHSNIIKKLRAKEKDNEQVIKSLRDKIAEQSAELDRLKRSMAAKEELEVQQIEAVHRLTTANKKLDTELTECKSQLEECQSRMDRCEMVLCRTNYELMGLRRDADVLPRLRAEHSELEAQVQHERDLANALAQQLQQLREEMLIEQTRWASREEALRQQVAEAQELLAQHADPPQQEQETGVAALLSQLAALQQAAAQRHAAHQDSVRALAEQLGEAESRATKAIENERLSQEENMQLTSQISELQDRLRESEMAAARLVTTEQGLKAAEALLAGKSRELEELRARSSAREAELLQQVHELETQLADERAALDTERKRYAILQEQMCTRGDISPPHSVVSDSPSSSLWPLDDSPAPLAAGSGLSALGVEEALSTLTRRDGELRALGRALASLQGERDTLRAHGAALQARLADCQGLQEQYDALLQMYGEKEEQLAELRLDLQDVTQLYKAQLDELLKLKQAAAAGSSR